MWIFKSFWLDLIKLYLPAFLGLGYLASLKPGEEISIFFYILVFYFLDTGHVYITWWRTILNPVELKREPLTWQIPIFFLLITLLWLMLKIPYYWSFVVYYTFYHNVKQGWGIIRWYEKLNNRFDNNAFFYFALTSLPLILFHFRNLPFAATYYTSGDFFLSTKLPSFIISIGTANLTFDNIVYFYLICVYSFIGLFWIAKELLTSVKIKKIELNRLFAMFFFMGVYSYSFIFSKSTIEVLAVLGLSHGFPYIFIMEKHFKRSWNFRKVFLLLAFLLLLGAAVSYSLEEFWLDQVFRYTEVTLPWWELLLTILYIVPTLSHCTWDIYLWRKPHPDVGNLYEV